MTGITRKILRAACGPASLALATLVFATDPAQAQPASAPVLAADRLPITLAGSYVCADGEHGMTLRLISARPDAVGTASVETEAADLDVVAVLAFYPIASGLGDRSGEAVGSFEMTGTLAVDGRIELAPDLWIERPDGYGGAGLEGRIAPIEGQTLLRLTGRPVLREQDGFCRTLVATELPF